ncbi:MAG: tetratricopeptide repeat protein [Methylobacter sp.]|jgi:cytochrome c-type biogenesis protein CcmH/NrfG|nr:tetratricopeptide repeat protein [Methylobacter sp.]
MSWRQWADELRQAPRQAVADLLRGAADIGPFERVTPHEFLLAVLPLNSRNVSRVLLGEPLSTPVETEASADLPGYLDVGLSAWLSAQREAPQPPARKLGAYAAQVCEALQWPLYFALPQTRAVLQADRAQWLQWLGSLTLTAYRDPEYDYWQLLASRQTDDSLQFFWQSFVVEAGRTRSARYLNLGLLALAKLPLSEDDSLRNLRLQVQALINRYQRRKGWGAPAQEELAQALRGVMARNLSMDIAHYRAFLDALLTPLGGDKTASVLALVGLGQSGQRYAAAIPSNSYKLKPPPLADVADQAVRDMRQSRSLDQAWKVIRPLLSTHEDYLHKSGDASSFLPALDKCARALCKKYELRDPEVQTRLFQWIHLALRMDADDPRRWMLWELALRQAGQPQRAQWVLWEMTRRFPDHLPCRVELARLLAASNTPDDQAQAQRLLQQVLQLDPDNVHAHSTLAQLAIRRKDWTQALAHAQRGLQIDPDDESCAVLLATAYARRNEPGDLQTAIDHLQRFVTRNKGQVNAESYLSRLLQRQQLAAHGKLSAFEDDEQAADTNTAPAETDSAWRAFAESINAWSSLSASGDSLALYSEDAALADRVLPLPQALRQAVARRQWDADVLDLYDAATRQEFPLETRLWRYLQSLQSTSSSERDHAKQAVQAWLDAEARASAQDNRAWLTYLNKRWEALNAPTDTALATGSEWLKDLLDRYQALPAPLFA